MEPLRTLKILYRVRVCKDTDIIYKPTSFARILKYHAYKHTAVCNPPCGKTADVPRGFCIQPGICQCYDGWAGVRCKIRKFKILA